MKNPLDEPATSFGNVKFNWTESDKPWYRMLWADTLPIANKYHQANLIIPLNENPDDRTAHSSPSASYLNLYSSSADFAVKTGGSRLQVGGSAPSPDALATHLYTYSMTSIIDGFQGYGISGTVNLKYTGNNLTLGAADQFTFMIHLKPGPNAYTDAGLNSGYGTIFRCSSTTDTHTDLTNYSEPFGVKINEHKQIEAHIHNSGAVVRSTTSLDIDKVQPVMVAVTYNKNRDGNNLRLIINGRVEDTADFTEDFSPGLSGNNHIYMGYNRNVGTAGHPLDFYMGLMEEITFHKKEAFFVPNTEYILNTDTLPNLNLPSNPTFSPALSGTYGTNTLQSRLFAMDYHNIRGVSPREVARSEAASWRVVGI